jgi:inosose dehydratase
VIGKTVMPKIGCQTYTWEMLGPKWTGTADDLLGAISSAGYAGIEITDRMIGSYANRPAAFATALKAHDLDLVAFACASPSGFTEPDALEQDLAMVGKALMFLQAFPGAILSLGSATIITPGDVADKFDTAAAFYNAAGKLGKQRGVAVAFHPSSHHNTLLGTRAEYDRIMNLTDPDLIGWVPDTGHILRQTHDMLDTLKTYLNRIRYLHLKDVDAHGQWQILGEGVCNSKAVIELMATAPNFNGWLVLEEESDTAAANPSLAIRKNHEMIAGLLQG